MSKKVLEMSTHMLYHVVYHVVANLKICEG